MGYLRLKLLGRFEARSDSGDPVDITATKAKALLACLVLAPDSSIARSKLLHLLWSDRSESQARASLRQLLWALRRSLQVAEPLPLVADEDSVTLIPELVQSDVAEFQRLVETGLPENLVKAVQLYEGDLLEDLPVRDPALEEHLLYEREHLRKLALDALQRVLSHQSTSEQIDEAAKTAQQILSIDPLQESAHRYLIGHYLRSGNPGLAVEQFKRCRDMLRRELGVEPSDETTRLLQESALQIGDKPANHTTDRESPGELHVEGRDESAGVNRVEESPGESVVVKENRRRDTSPLTRRLILVVAIVLVTVGGAAYWFKPWLPQDELTSTGNKPSIAVMPFINMSGDPAHEYFSDGITEDLTTDLSKISGLLVISRNSSFSYKGKAMPAKDVANELSVRYILEGSVRRVGDQVRINAQLIDTSTDSHLWAERYDGSVADIFSLQDQVTRKITTALAVNLTPDEKTPQKLAQTDNPEAYDAFLQGWSHYLQETRSDFGKAFGFFERAIELDPDYARAHAALAGTYIYALERSWQYRLRRCNAIPPAEEHLRLAMRQPNALAHRSASFLRLGQGKYDEAITEAERAIALGPNDAESYDALGAALIFSGRAADTIELYEKAMRLNPHYPAHYLQYLGMAYFNIGQYEEAAVNIERARKRNPELSPFTLMAAYGYLDRREDADAALKDYWKARDLPEDYEVDVEDAIEFFYYQHRADAEHLGKGLIKAGMCCEDKLQVALDSMLPGGRQFRGIEIPKSYQLPNDVTVMTEADIHEQILGNTIISEYEGEKDSQYFLGDGMLLGVWTDVRYCDYWAVSGPVFCVGITSDRYCETLALEGSMLKSFELDGTPKPVRELVQGNALEQ